MTKKQTTLSDRELRQALASLREDVAAPADFRAKLMQRLQREGIVAADARVGAAQPTLARRLAAFFTPARLGLAASAALALVLVLRFTAPPPAPLAVNGPLPAVEPAKNMVPAPQGALLASERVKKNAGLAQGPKSENLPEAFLGEEQSRKLPAAAPAMVGDEAAASSQGAMTGSVADVVAKPTIVVVHPTPTAVTKALDGNSELRGNVVRASQGEAAVLLYRVKEPGHVHVEIFSRLGESVAVLRDADEGPGVYDLRWGGGADKGGMAATGIYVLLLQAPGYQVQHKLMLVK